MVFWTKWHNTPIAPQSRAFRNVVDLRRNVTVPKPSTDTAAERGDTFHVVADGHSRISARLVDSCDRRMSASILRESYLTCASSHSLRAFLTSAK